MKRVIQSTIVVVVFVGSAIAINEFNLMSEFAGAVVGSFVTILAMSLVRIGSQSEFDEIEINRIKGLEDELDRLSIKLGKTERIKENLEKQLLSTKQHYQNKINDFQESSIQQLRERAKERRLEVEDA